MPGPKVWVGGYGGCESRPICAPMCVDPTATPNTTTQAGAHTLLNLNHDCSWYASWVASFLIALVDLACEDCLPDPSRPDPPIPHELQPTRSEFRPKAPNRPIPKIVPTQTDIPEQSSDPTRTELRPNPTYPYMFCSLDRMDVPSQIGDPSPNTNKIGLCRSSSAESLKCPYL